MRINRRGHDHLAEERRPVEINDQVSKWDSLYDPDSELVDDLESNKSAIKGYRASAQAGHDCAAAQRCHREHPAEERTPIVADDYASERLVPVFDPDPDIIGNSEGNRRILAADKAGAQAVHDRVQAEKRQQ